MTQGIILLVIIALIVAYVVARTRRRMGLLVTGKTWLMVMIAVIIGALALWASSDALSFDRPRGRLEHVSEPWPRPLIGISNQTALPSFVGRDPHRRGELVDQVQAAAALVALARAADPRQPQVRVEHLDPDRLVAASQAEREVLTGRAGEVSRRTAAISQSPRMPSGPGPAPSSTSSCRGVGETAACSTTLVTTSETSRQARSACSTSMSQQTNVSCASRRASDTRIGSAGNWPSQDARSTSDVRTTTTAISSSISPGTACSAASATCSTGPVGGSPHRVPEHLLHLGVGVVPLAVSPLPPVD